MWHYANFDHYNEGQACLIILILWPQYSWIITHTHTHTHYNVIGKSVTEESPNDQSWFIESEQWYYIQLSLWNVHSYKWAVGISLARLIS